MLDIENLQSLINSGEGYNVEFKVRADNRQSLQRTVR